MNEFIPVIELTRCRENDGTFVQVDGRELAVFRFGDPERVVVTDNACPHANGNLSAGAITDGVVTCPWHAWEFDLTTGQCTRSADACIHVYPIEVRDGTIYAQLDESHRFG
jgi:NAD(P)H-dependent nitrite reductase small subunit